MKALGHMIVVILLAVWILIAAALALFAAVAICRRLGLTGAKPTDKPPAAAVAGDTLNPDDVLALIDRLTDKLLGARATIAAAPVIAPPPQPQPQPQPQPKPDPPPQPAPAPQPKPEPPPIYVEPTAPLIVMQDRLGNDVPSTGRVGELFVVSLGKSKNFKMLKATISPEVPYDYDPLSKKLAFSVANEGRYTLNVVATSPDGGLATWSHPITFGEPENAALPASMSMPARPANYVQFVVNEARKMTHANRKGDLLAMAGPFSAAWGLVQTGGIRSRQELFNYTDKQLESALGGDLEACTPFITSLLHATSSEPANMDRLAEVWQEISEGCRRAAR